MHTASALALPAPAKERALTGTKPGSGVALKPAQAGQPKHLAVILDGNGRWASSQGLPRLAGHAKGVEAVRELVTACLDRGIAYVSLYAFSAQNWKRPADEVRGLMELLKTFLAAEAEELAQQGVKLRQIGSRADLPEEIKEALADAETRTQNGQHLTLNLAINYGGKEELVQAAQSLARDVAAGKLDATSITPELLEARLGTAGQPPVDLLIRTAGERRLSNFLLWQSAYAELLFMDTLWPDFTSAHLDQALADFGGRRRTYGGLTDAKSP